MKKLFTILVLAASASLSLAQSWTAVNTNLPALTARGLAKIGDTLLVGIKGGGVYYTVNNGNTWQAHFTSAYVQNSDMNKFYGSKASAGDDSYFFVLGIGNVQYYEQNNGFYSVNNLTSQLSDNYVLSYDKSENPGTHFFGTLGGLFSFGDGANDPMVTATGLNGDAAVVYSVFDNDSAQVIAGTMAGLYISNDNGASFTIDQTTIPATTRVNEVAIFTLTSDGVYFLQQQGPAFLPLVQGGDYRCYYWDMTGTGNAVMFGDNVGTLLDGSFNTSAFDLTGVSGGPIVGTVIMGEYTFVCTESGGVFRYGASVAPEAPVAPSNLTATVFKTQSNYVELSWTDNSANEDGFEVERSTDGQNFTSLGTVAADVVGYQDNALAPLTTYFYRVLAFNTVGNSTASNVVEITTDASVGIAENANYSLRLFPNPAKELLTINTSETLQVKITELSGRVVMTGLVSNNNNTLNISALQEGMYLVHLNGKTLRFVKQ